ncbi:hypothetical protein [Burkholderia oklahomensis]|uniref:Uncharacterized protein n=1 Tax=Burkholderia oklahomensis TaxID=342113 RepID=A0AAI8FNP0_9BURK|nr:hypothetical protein [Burkholderia oklahomensis]AIO67801.1 hypothetical protein DM82_350 [Burkholderia oklahomensis]AJX30214.1 hypothetical protein BG90_680 [Burkholderia oklahomensis C6786]MBI0360518.1 hypothetical protein [Burkholderia oklahomensis]QPS38000.1 hypothetical protein I6G57_03970 [Burkholderia oklahomensis]SUW59895.1 Uncharacterised protein [Burkholderia oklahomensis]
MKASEAIQQIQTDVAGAKADGAQQIVIANLEAYLATALQKAQAEESAASAEQIAQVEHNLEVWKARLAANTNHSIEMFKSVVEAGQTALRSAIVINGGAAAALLAFAGNAITKGQSLAGDPLLSKIGLGLAWFVAGMGCAGMATGLRYLAQFAYSVCHANQQRRGVKATANTLNWTSIVLGAVSFATFFVGGYSTYLAIAKPNDTPIANVASQQKR